MSVFSAIPYRPLDTTEGVESAIERAVSASSVEFNGGLSAVIMAHRALYRGSAELKITDDVLERVRDEITRAQKNTRLGSELGFQAGDRRAGRDAKAGIWTLSRNGDSRFTGVIEKCGWFGAQTSGTVVRPTEHMLRSGHPSHEMEVGCVEMNPTVIAQHFSAAPRTALRCVIPQNGEQELWTLVLPSREIPNTVFRRD